MSNKRNKTTRNWHAVAAHNRKGGPMTDKKKEQSRKICRLKNGNLCLVNGGVVYEDELEEIKIPKYKKCSCSESLYLIWLIRSIADYLQHPDIDEFESLDEEIKARIIEVLEREQKDDK